jgi:hypothetical protein
MFICREKAKNTENAEPLLDASNGVHVEVNAEKTKYVLMSRRETTDRNHHMKVADKTRKLCCLECLRHIT